MIPNNWEESSYFRQGDAKFLNSHDTLISMLNEEQRDHVEELIINNKWIPVSAVTLVIITANQGKL